MKNIFELNETRKSFLVIWIVIMFLPSVFMVGMMFEKNNVRVVVESDLGVSTYTRTMHWGDLVYYFMVLFFGTVSCYWVVGLNERDKVVK